MEVNVKLTITSEEFFDAVAEAIVYDVHQCTGKNIRAKNIKRGMSYTKKANKIKTMKKRLIKPKLINFNKFFI